MPQAHEQLKKGQVFGPATVVGPAVPEYRVTSGKRRRFVVVECWPCKGHREVQVAELLAGRVKLCLACHRKRRGGAGKIAVGDAAFELLQVEAVPKCVGSLRELEL